MTHLTASELDLLCATALEAVQRAIVITDLDTHLFASAQARSFLRMERPEQIVGRPVDEVVHPVARDAARERRHVMLASKRGLSGYKVKLVGGDGSDVETPIAARALSSDSGSALMFDLAGEQVDSYDAVAVQRLTVIQAAAEVLPVPIVIHDPERMVFLNAAARQLVQASVEQTEGVPFTDFVHPDALEAGRHRRSLVWRDGLVIHDIPLKLVATDGRPVRTCTDAFQHVVNERPYMVLMLRAGCDSRSARISAAPPRYGRNASGTSTLPSARW